MITLDILRKHVASSTLSNTIVLIDVYVQMTKGFKKPHAIKGCVEL